MGSRGKNVFSSDLAKQFPFLIQNKEKTQSDVVCNICKSSFSVANSGRSDIIKHTNTEKHKKSQLAVASSKKVNNLFKNVSMGKSEETLAAREGLIAYHTVMHYHSFNSVSCTSKLIKSLYEEKFTCGKTKCESIIVNVFAPFSIDSIVKELEESKFVTVSLDSSNHKSVKMVPLLIRYFLPSKGVQVKLLDLQSQSGETSDILKTYLLSVLDKYNITSKLIGMCADNTNTNYGGSQRGGQNNVYFKLKTHVERDIVGVGCAAHIIHNAIKTSSDLLPIDYETFVVKIYSHFYLYTVRVESLKKICVDNEFEYLNVIGYCKTRFLELHNSLTVILELFGPLKEYFLKLPKCPKVLQTFYEDDSSEIWLMFLHYQTGVFNKAVLQVEGENTTIFKVAQVIKNLKVQLEARARDKFLPSVIKKELNILVKEKKVNRKEFVSTVVQFYETTCEYLVEWGGPFLEFEKFFWVELRSELEEWGKIESSVNSLIEKVKDYQVVIDDSQVYDEVVLLREYLGEKMILDWNNNNVDTGVRWVEIFNHFRSANQPLTSLEILIEFLMALPGSNAPTERVFSKANKTWTKDKSSLSVSTLRAMLISKCNYSRDCMDFYKFLLSQPKLLTKIHSSDKYTNNNNEQ